MICTRGGAPSACVREPREVDISSADRLAQATDATLALRAGDGDVQAFEAVARRHGPLMRVVASRLLGTDAEADDVVQESFLTAWHRLAGLDEPERLRNWLMRIVTNKAIDRLRTRRDHDDVDDHQPPAPRRESPDHVVEQRLQLDAVWRAVDLLPLDQRRCWLLREIAGWTYAEIAEALGTTPSTVRGQLARARRSVLAEMEEWR